MGFKDVIYTDFLESKCMIFKIERTHQIPSTMDKKRLVSMHITVQFQKPEIKEIKTQKDCRLDFKIKQEKQCRLHVKGQETVWPAEGRPTGSWWLVTSTTNQTQSVLSL